MGNRLGIVDSFIQKLRNKIQLYFDEYDTTNYIDVVYKLVKNINNTYNSGIQTIPNKPDNLKIEQVMTQNLLNAVNSAENKQYNVGDNVRRVINKKII